MEGYLDGVSRGSIRGWAIDNDRPAELVATVNGNVLARFTCSITRPDLKAFATQDAGFEIKLARELVIGDVVSVTNASHEHLRGSPHEFKLTDLSKEDKALWLIRKDMKVLEIGPSFNPVAPKSSGWYSFSLDHATEDELRAKYKGQQALERIEPVDYLWKDGPLHAAVPEREYGTFDALIASHVLEHIPDPISFFRSATVLLKPEGLVSLVMPDKRMIFDFFKPVTLTSDWLMAHRNRLTRHTKKTAFDYIAYNVNESHQITWSLRPLGEFNFFGYDVLTEAKQAFDHTPDDCSGPYVDYHATICTPSSLELIFLELKYLGLLPFEHACSFPVSGCEFYVTLRKSLSTKSDPETIGLERLKLMKATVRELAQQARWLLDD